MIRSQSVRALFAGIALSLIAGCAGRNIHRDLKADNAFMTRGWTITTRSAQAEAGDRGFDLSTPVPYENTLIFGSRSAGLVSVYPGLARVRWKLEIPGGVLSDPLIHRNTVLVGGADGYFYSVNADTGKVLWRYEEKNTLVSQPSVSNGRVFFTTSDDTVYALDAGTGKWLWHYKRRTGPTAKIVGASSPLIDSGEAIVGMSDGYLVALSVEDGSLKWERRLHHATKFTDVDATPVLIGEVLYVPSYDGALYALRRAGGEILWRFDAGAGKRVHLDDTKIYLPSSEGSVMAVDRSSGKAVWKFELDRGVPTALASTDKYLIFGSSFQYLYIVDKATGQGVYRWNVGNGSGFSAAPMLDSEKNNLYILSKSGHLYQFNLQKNPRAGELYEFYKPL